MLLTAAISLSLLSIDPTQLNQAKEEAKVYLCEAGYKNVETMTDFEVETHYVICNMLQNIRKSVELAKGFATQNLLTADENAELEKVDVAVEQILKLGRESLYEVLPSLVASLKETLTQEEMDYLFANVVDSTSQATQEKMTSVVFKLMPIFIESLNSKILNSSDLVKILEKE